MSTAATTTRPGRVTVALLHEHLAQIVAQDPGRVDERPELELPPRYVTNGEPACLVARLLTRLGYSLGILRDLDREYARGELRNAGVRIAESRHPALRRLDPDARALLEYLQRGQDAGLSWGTIAHKAFAPCRFGRGVDQRKRPWLYHRSEGDQA